MAEFKTVSANDPAIDRAATGRKGLVAFGETRDMKHLVFLPGAKPVVYHLKEISHSRMTRWVMSSESEPEQCSRAFQAAVIRIDDLAAADGIKLGPGWVPPMIGDLDPLMADEAMERFPLFAILEIGGVAYRRSFFGPSTTLTYALPPMLAAHLDAQMPLRAAASQTSAEPTSAAASAPSEAKPGA